MSNPRTGPAAIPEPPKDAGSFTLADDGATWNPTVEGDTQAPSPPLLNPAPAPAPEDS